MDHNEINESFRTLAEEEISTNPHDQLKVVITFVDRQCNQADFESCNEIQTGLIIKFT